MGHWAFGAMRVIAPGDLVKQIAPVFNRAVIFDTTCNIGTVCQIQLNAQWAVGALPSISYGQC